MGEQGKVRSKPFPDDGWTMPTKKKCRCDYPRLQYLEELLGHVCAAALINDVGNGENNLEGDNHEDEEAHARSGRGDGY
jgi:hypothetical protein